MENAILAGKVELAFYFATMASYDEENEWDADSAEHVFQRLLIMPTKYYQAESIVYYKSLYDVYKIAASIREMYQAILHLTAKNNRKLQQTIDYYQIESTRMTSNLVDDLMDQAISLTIESKKEPKPINILYKKQIDELRNARPKKYDYPYSIRNITISSSGFINFTE